MSNNKQKKELNLIETIELCSRSAILDYTQCRGDKLCCGESKPLIEFSPSALKCICKECSKKITEKNRRDKIDNSLDRYIDEKIRNRISKVGIFSSVLICSKKFFYDWIKSQSKDPFNEHFDHFIPIHFFKQFSNASS